MGRYESRRSRRQTNGGVRSWLVAPAERSRAEHVGGRPAAEKECGGRVRAVKPVVQGPATELAEGSCQYFRVVRTALYKGPRQGSVVRYSRPSGRRSRGRHPRPGCPTLAGEGIVGSVADLESVLLRRKEEPAHDGSGDMIDDLAALHLADGVRFTNEVVVRQRPEMEEAPPGGLGLSTMPIEQIGQQCLSLLLDSPLSEVRQAGLPAKPARIRVISGSSGALDRIIEHGAGDSRPRTVSASSTRRCLEPVAKRQRCPAVVFVVAGNDLLGSPTPRRRFPRRDRPRRRSGGAWPLGGQPAVRIRRRLPTT